MFLVIFAGPLLILLGGTGIMTFTAGVRDAMALRDIHDEHARRITIGGVTLLCMGILLIWGTYTFHWSRAFGFLAIPSLAIGGTLTTRSLGMQRLMLWGLALVVITLAMITWTIVQVRLTCRTPSVSCS